MTPTPTGPLARAGSIPELAFSVEDAGTLEHAAVPTLRFGVRIDAPGGEPIKSILLDTQVQIAARRRRHVAVEEERLFELFGERERWGTTLRTLPWTRQTQSVPPFTGSTLIDVAVPCTYDFDVVASRYLDALDGGEVPLELLFSGTLFYSDEGGLLKTSRIAWDREAEFGLPVSVWKGTMESYFRDQAWLRMRKATFDRLQAYRSRNALTSWEDAIESLLPEDEAR
ncbi:MAG: hypothetical protein QOD53_1235 [Thermoleophilaceae bacterium]|jgi:hypothetical protein|nr:hypothetical protein [Thermoleophilaceae bacterium]